jgi:hypothetical protein
MVILFREVMAKRTAQNDRLENYHARGFATAPETLYGSKWLRARV